MISEQVFVVATKQVYPQKCQELIPDPLNEPDGKAHCGDRVGVPDRGAERRFGLCRWGWVA